MAPLSIPYTSFKKPEDLSWYKNPELAHPIGN